MSKITNIYEKSRQGFDNMASQKLWLNPTNVKGMSMRTQNECEHCGKKASTIIPTVYEHRFFIFEVCFDCYHSQQMKEVQNA